MENASIDFFISPVIAWSMQASVAKIMRREPKGSASEMAFGIEVPRSRGKHQRLRRKQGIKDTKVMDGIRHGLVAWLI